MIYAGLCIVTLLRYYRYTISPPDALVVIVLGTMFPSCQNILSRALPEKRKMDWSTQGAYTFTVYSSQATQISKLTPSVTGANSYFGYNVSMSNDFAIVGAPYETVNGSIGAGAAYIFVRLGSNWVENGRLVPPHSQSQSYFDTVFLITMVTL